MIRFLSAFARLRWRLLLNGLRGTARRDTLEQVSRIVAVIVPIGLALSVVSFALGFAFLGFFGGRYVGTGRLEPHVALLVARLALFALFAMIVLFPLGGTGHGSIATHPRLRLLPIPRRSLHFVETLSGAFDPWVAFLVPGLGLFSLGLAMGGRPYVALVALAAAGAFLAAVLAFGALVAFVAGWLLRGRRRSELFVLVSVLVITAVSLAPAWFSTEMKDGERARIRIDATALPAWTQALPSEIYARTIDAALGGRSGAAAGGLGLLVFETVLLYGLSYATYGRLIDSVEGGARRRGVAAPVGGLRLPGLPPVIGAVAWAQFRTALRTVRGRLIVLFPAPLVASLGLFSRRMPDEVPGGAYLGAHGHLLLGVGIVFGLYSLLAFTMNQFATDRAGLTLQLLAPISDLDLVRGKAIGLGLLTATTIAPAVAGAWIVAPGGSPWLWIAVLLGAAATYLLVAPIAALLSACLPVQADLSKTGSGGNPHGLTMLAGTVLVILLAGPPGLVIALVGHRLARPGLAALSVAAWVVLAALVAVPTLGLAARAVGPRRENLALVAQGR